MEVIKPKVDLDYYPRKTAEEELIRLIYKTGTLKKGDPWDISSPYHYLFRRSDVIHRTYKHLSYSEWLMHFSAFGIALNHRRAIKEKKLKFVVGVPNAANRLAESIQEITGLPVLYLGRQDDRVTPEIVGKFKPKRRQKGLIVDDILTSGDNIIETGLALIANGLKVGGIGVAVYREEGGLERLQEQFWFKLAKANINSVTTTSRIIEQGLVREPRPRILTNKFVRQVQDYIESKKPSSDLKAPTFA